MQLKRLDRQVVAVVGASSGIGRETALRLARRGARVVVAARGEEGLRSLVEEIRSAGGQATAVVADVREFEQVRAIAERAIETYGHLDTWVHLAAVSMWAPFAQTTPEEFKQIIDVDLTGQAYGAMAALPHLRREGRGALIHVSSVEARVAFPLQSAYTAAKHGMHGFLKALRLELEHEGIPVSVTEVMPASINTPLFNKARTKLGVKPMPMPPIYQPHVVAEAILHAAEHPTRELIAGGAGAVLSMTQRLSPRMADAFLLSTAFRAQRTNEPKSEADPDNLFAPIPGYDRVEGDFTSQARSTSAGTWLETHPVVKRTLGILALGSLALVAARALGRGQESVTPCTNGDHGERGVTTLEDSLDSDEPVEELVNQS
jgi:NAD(P)-dependent dehydrogenase (short-subunit alcohol dehydrogenase family)